MKRTISKISSLLLAVTISTWSANSFAQAPVIEQSVITNSGTVTEFVPAQETLIMKTETSPEPLRYTITRRTTFVDETGAPVVVEKIAPGLPVAVDFTRSGDRLVVSRVIVRRAPAAIEERTTTTTTTTEDVPLTHREKERLKKMRHEEKERLEKEAKEQKRDREIRD